MTKLELEELRGAWARAVKLDESAAGELYAAPCWFAHNVPGAGPCEGWIEGAHWIKRQRVERWVLEQCGGLYARAEARGIPFVASIAGELRELAAWDPRNGVPGCEGHHARFDAHLMPPLVVPRSLVPAHVIDFCDDWGLEQALDDKHPKET